MQGFDAATPEQLLSPDQSELLAQITGQLADSTRAQKDAACKEVREACEKEHSRKCKRLQDTAAQEKQKLMHEHEVAMAEVACMTTRRKQDNEQFTFTIRGHTTPELSGSIPRSIFEAEPNSVLNKTYNGEWTYATPTQGRACINSNPAHWPLFLNWLSFGSVPTQPSDAFIAECRYWQLHNLLYRLENAPTGQVQHAIRVNTERESFTLTKFEEEGLHGFQLRASIHNFEERFSAGCVSLHFKAFANRWRLSLGPEGVYLKLMSGPPAKQAQATILFGLDDAQWKYIRMNPYNFSCEGSGRGRKWAAEEKGILRRPPKIDLDGSLPVTLKVLLQQPLQGKSCHQIADLLQTTQMRYLSHQHARAVS